MIFTDFYKFTQTKNTRFDCLESTASYDYFETSLLNKKGAKVGGLSLHLTNRPETWKNGHKSDKALSRVKSISSIYRPDINSPIGYGDVKGTNDAIIIIYNQDFKENGINSIEILIARGCKADKINLFNLFSDSEFLDEVELLKNKAQSTDLRD